MGGAERRETGGRMDWGEARNKGDIRDRQMVVSKG